MKRLIYLLLAIAGIAVASCNSSPSDTGKQKEEEETPIVPEPQPEPDRKIVTGYLPLDDWEFDKQYPSVAWEHLTHINASFIRAKADGTLNTQPAEKNLEKVRDDAHRNGVKILISVAKNSPGEFKAAISDSEARKKLAQQIVAFTRDNKLDGFDIDYEEYDDWDNYFPSLLAFAKELHSLKEEGMLMTCAVNSRWLNYGTEWERYFDYINLMSYDRGAFTDKPVQHASYDDFVKDLEYWHTEGKADKSKIVGGLPFYGYSWDEELKDKVDAVRGIRYHSILEHFGDRAADTDAINQTYYNGRPTIRKKCQYVKENGYGGVMIWQLFQDGHESQKSLRLIEAVGDEMGKQ